MDSLFAIIVVLMALVHFSFGEKNQEHPLRPAALISTSTQLQYHHGPLLTGANSINIYIIWYGALSPTHKTIVSDLFASFRTSPETGFRRYPSVATWWKTTQAYKDSKGKPVPTTVTLAGVSKDATCSLGKNIKRAHIATLVKTAIWRRVFPFDPNAVYFVLTASDVIVERFCMSSCGFHDTTVVFPSRQVVFAHVGDPGVQCPGLCAWPFAVPLYGPPGAALVAPSGDKGVDGMVMNIATVLVGSATNPWKNGYFQGDALAPLEAVTACPGIFGNGAYPGYPGKLMVDVRSKASYNVYGINGRLFLLPSMWDPVSLACKVVT